ncbi:hypothetical protein [Vibrio cholerae]|uniref:hypothetical protein n=1 Tax=Vibrio cholerae TaxID=666 RepID=UPI00111C49BD|nr:hypothetical protein [Vibrio cholerae]EGR4436996.1 hypothetical protein [Vibrio cholerae]MCU4222256.1 hypothetical protein [Vibrio cholerae]TXZ65838.1 hypothetical protein FXE41_02710 [Vibrio cholerae]GIB39420.1 hypothetical protein VCSRO44_3518 [Vibrio cholerae]HCZ9577487.1 hypothetical protein [Vibrio cholerae]
MVDFFSNGLSTYCWNINRELSRIESYNAAIENLWAINTDTIEAKYSDKLGSLEGDEQNELGQADYSELIERTILPSIIHNQSIVVTLSSFVEYSLLKLCLKINEFSIHEFKPPKRSKIQKCMDYLLQVLEVESNPKLVSYYQVRNEIVHNSGICSQAFGSKDMTFSDEQIKFRVGDRIDIKPLFIADYIEAVKQYFSDLELGIRSFIRSYKNNA